MFFLFAITDLAALDDPALARRIKRGDAGAFKAFFERHHDVLYRYLRARGLPGVVCEDLIQNAFLTIWERRHEIDEQKSLRAFLFKICYTRALNHFRDTAKFTDTASINDPVAPSAPDHEANYALMLQTLRIAVEALPERRRAVFELCFLQELTYREAAEALGISIKTVENQMGHALKTIRKAMEGYVRET